MIGLGAGIILFVALFLFYRWSVERKKQKELSEKVVAERSFTNASVCQFPHRSLRSGSRAGKYQAILRNGRLHLSWL